jgi:hypothetical protein
MRNVSGYFVVAAVSVFVNLGFSSGFADTPSLDPTVVAPEEFQTAFENEFVRVVRVTVVDGSEPARHSHPPRVVIFANECTWIETADDGSIFEETNAAGEVLWQESVIHGGYPNRVKDTCELFEIELK